MTHVISEIVYIRKSRSRFNNEESLHDTNAREINSSKVESENREVRREFDKNFKKEEDQNKKIVTIRRQ
jgi:hypothetical protein